MPASVALARLPILPAEVAEHLEVLARGLGADRVRVLVVEDMRVTVARLRAFVLDVAEVGPHGETPQVRFFRHTSGWVALSRTLITERPAGDLTRSIWEVAEVTGLDRVEVTQPSRMRFLMGWAAGWLKYLDDVGVVDAARRGVQ